MAKITLETTSRLEVFETPWAPGPRDNRGKNLAITYGWHNIADMGDVIRTVSVDAVMTARFRREDVIDNANIIAGDVIVGLASFGQSLYEKAYNGGMGSNGLTSARHDVLDSYLASKYPESFDPEVHSALVYSGSKRLTDAVENTPVNVGQLILSPTRTYAPFAKTLLDELRPQIHGMVHCSGGAQTKVLHFIDNLHVVKNNLFPIPPLFKLIQAESGTSWQEMYKVFNMGHRMEIYVNPDLAEELISISKSFGVDAQIIGRVESSATKKLTIESEFGRFEYA